MNNSFRLEPTFIDNFWDRMNSAVGQLPKLAKQNEELFSWQLKSFRPPPKEQLGILLMAAFWASIKQVEGRYHGFSLTFCDPDNDENTYVFSEPLPFDADHVTKLATALSATESQIGVRMKSGSELSIWGFKPSFGSSLLVLKAFDPAQVVAVSYAGVSLTSALITGERATFIQGNKLPAQLAPAVDGSSQVDLKQVLKDIETANDLKTIARAMRSHRHGGTLLVVPNVERWRQSITGLDLTSREPYQRVRKDLRNRDQVGEKEKKQGSIIFSLPYHDASEAARRSLKLLGRLTAIDGATIITSDFDLLAFGAKIKALNSDKNPQDALVTIPLEGSLEESRPVSGLGGMRHQSAAQFVFDQRDSFAIVASQDGRLSVLNWNRERQTIAVTQHAEYALESWI